MSKDYKDKLLKMQSVNKLKRKTGKSSYIWMFKRNWELGHTCVYKKQIHYYIKLYSEFWVGK